MKKILAVALVVAMMSCNNDANDADPTTDTTNFNREPMDTGSLSPAIGDTSLKMDPSTGTDTTSRPYTGGTGDTGKDGSSRAGGGSGDTSRGSRQQ